MLQLLFNRMKTIPKLNTSQQNIAKHCMRWTTYILFTIWLCLALIFLLASGTGFVAQYV